MKIRPRGLERREETEDQGSERREPEREQEDPRVWRGGKGELGLLRGREKDETAGSPIGEHEAESAAGERQQQAFDQELFHDSRTARAEREPERHLLLAARRFRDEEVGHVGAGDEEHEPDQDHEHPKGLR